MNAFDPLTLLSRFWSRLEARGFGWRSLILLAAGFVALLISSGVSLWSAAAMKEQSAWIDHSREVRTSLDLTERHVINAVAAQRRYLLTGEEPYADLEAVERSAALQELQDLRSLVRDNPDQSERVELAQPLVEERLAITQQIVWDARSGRFNQALTLLRDGPGPDISRRMEAHFAAIDEVEQQILAERERRARLAERVNFWFSTLGVFLILVVAGLAIFQFARNFAALAAAHNRLDETNIDLERRVAARTADLAAASEEVQRFAYIVSHDLRAPLVNVMGYTSELQAASRAFEKQLEIIEDKAPKLVQPDAALAVREDVPEAIGFIRTSTEKMDRLINAILQLSREGRRRIEPQELDMTLLVETIADSVNHQTEAVGAEIVVESLPTIVSDRLMIEQVFSNLIDNAVKYLDPKRPGRIVVRAEDVGARNFRFLIEDNGRGIADKDHERIFELFRRAGKQDQVGEGLGLAFVRNTVRRLGGAISVSSVVGEGSTFELILPKRLGTGDGERS